MKKLLAIGLCVIMVLCLAACGKTEKPDGGTPSTSATPGGSTQTNAPSSQAPSSAPAESAAPAKDTLNIGVDSDTGSLHPFNVSGGFLSVMNAYAEPLWTYDGTAPGFATKWLLATSVDTISDLEYVVHLREGVTFSNGSPFTASDVIFTLNYTINESTQGYYIGAVDVPNCVAEDDYTVRLKMKYFDKTQMAGLSNITMIDEQTFDPETCGQNPIGTGPYVVTEYVVNSYVKMTARDDYWGGKPAFKYVVYKNIPEASQKVTAIETGEIDVLLSVPEPDIEYVDSLDGVSVITKAVTDQVCLTFNGCEGSPLESKEARWAVAHAVNSAGVVRVALNGNGTVAVGPYSTGCADFYPELANIHDTYAIGYDIDLAKQYAEQSGLAGKTVRLVTNGTDVYATTAQIIEQALKEIGVNAEIINLDQATVRNLIAGVEGWEIYVSWITNPSGIGADMIYAQTCKFNRAHFEHKTDVYEKLNSLGLAALALSDEDAYRAAVKTYVEAYVDECYTYGIADRNAVRAHADYIGGMTTEGFGMERAFDLYYIG